MFQVAGWPHYAMGSFSHEPKHNWKKGEFDIFGTRWENLISENQLWNFIDPFYPLQVHSATCHSKTLGRFFIKVSLSFFVQSNKPLRYWDDIARFRFALSFLELIICEQFFVTKFSWKMLRSNLTPCQQLPATANFSSSSSSQIENSSSCSLIRCHSNPKTVKWNFRQIC